MATEVIKRRRRKPFQRSVCPSANDLARCNALQPLFKSATATAFFFFFFFSSCTSSNHQLRQLLSMTPPHDELFHKTGHTSRLPLRGAVCCFGGGGGAKMDGGAAVRYKKLCCRCRRDCNPAPSLVRFCNVELLQVMG